MNNKDNKKWYEKPLGIILLGVIIILVSYYFFGIGKAENNSEEDEISITNSSFKNSPIFYKSSGNSVVYNENKQIPLNIPIVMGLDPSKFTNFDFLNTKFILPNNSEAFVSKMSHGEEYIIAYHNDDCSDFYVSEKYKMTEEIQTEDLCFIVTLQCESGIQEMVLGPKAFDGAINGPNGCLIKPLPN